MVGKNDQDYPFIKETIKKRPVDKKAVVQKLLLAAVCGIIFGFCAAVTIAVVMPSVLNAFGKGQADQETVHLSPPVSRENDLAVSGNPLQESDGVSEVTAETSGALSEETVQAESASSAGTNSQQEETVSDDLADHLTNIYNEIKKIAQEPQKALVRVSGIGENEDLLDHSSLTYGDEEGIVFLKNREAFYVLTISDTLGESENFRIVFSTGDTAEGTLCGADSRTNILVIRVPMDAVDEDTRDSINAVPLAAEADQEQADPVIAIGSPTGDAETLVYGNITSVYGKYQIPDAEYTLLTTDMVGSSSGGGVLLDMEGQMIGLMVADSEEEGTVIRAISAAQLRPLLEALSNGEKIRYAGIQGETVTEDQAEKLDIPQGVYVDGVDENSPAMSAGIQSGDIIHKIGDIEILTMQEYSEALQDLPLWQSASVSLYRRDPSGEYVNVELSVLIEKK